MKAPDHRNGRVLALVVTALASAAVAAMAAAAPSPNLKRLVLQAADFPVGTHADTGYGTNGPLASTYAATFQIHPGDLKREEGVEIQVWLAKDTASAKNIYEQALATYTGKGPKIGPVKEAFKGESILKLPAYGDEQYADYLPTPTRPHGQLIVRKGSVVWYLTVENCTPLSASCYGTSRTEAPIGKAQATSELKRYGAKQRARAGAST